MNCWQEYSAVLSGFCLLGFFRAVERNGFTNERLERRSVDFLAFGDINGAACIALET
jgi:hypothetical protein